MAKSKPSVKEGMTYRAIIRVGGEVVGIISRLSQKDVEREALEFKKGCKEIWKNEIVTIKYKVIK
jgi:hypothetical protein